MKYSPFLNQLFIVSLFVHLFYWLISVQINPWLILELVAVTFDEKGREGRLRWTTW